MRSSFWGYLIILLGIGIIVTMLLIYSFASTSENDYYLVKETMEAAMIDALDDTLYECKGELSIDEKTFVESFIRRFSDINNYDKTYTINFYNINETPPMASVEIITKTDTYSIAKDATDVPIVTRIDGILDVKE